MNRFYEMYGMESDHERREWDNRDKAPAWYIHGNQTPCKCYKQENSELIQIHSGYSDALYAERKCLECGTTHVYWVEG